jgi:hypothetical protein
MWGLRGRWLTLVVGLAALVAALAPEARAEDSAEIDLPAPQRVSLSAERVAPLALDRSSKADTNRREQLLREHMLPVPILEALRPAAALEVRPLANETGVAPSANVLIELDRVLSDVETAGRTSLLTEASLAVGSTSVLATGNTWAAISKDGGATFRAINPATAFPSVGGQHFCCDQVALHDEATGLTVWLLQYYRDAEGNRLRIAVADATQFASDDWAYYDLPTKEFGWRTEWFDFPDLALSDGHLYVTTNAFTNSSAPTFTRAVLLRLPIRDLLARTATTARYFHSPDCGSLRLVQGRGPVMYGACHRTLDRLSIFSWDDAATTLQIRPVDIERWVRRGAPYPGPDGRDWLDRSDGRITAGWRVGGEVGFAWNAAADAQRPLPHVRVVVLDAATGRILSQPTLWNRSIAFAYPAASVSMSGRVGMSVFFGGGAVYPSHAVGILRPPSPLEPDGGWDLVPTTLGTSGPSQAVWGDYGACRRWGTQGESLGATGWALVGGPNSHNIEVRIIRFRPDVSPTPLVPELALQAIELRRAALEKEILRLEKAAKALR